ncbi:transcription factor Adf-1-like [Penaeus japonicus]|uniref:transcription factor Adf-1-like n=1 Tax=Penaeus japonicus TaxID=27405 RepID=UPI001C70DC48|nr:transcription factor Adf-1-like [Penaeus japonicus]
MKIELLINSVRVRPAIYDASDSRHRDLDVIAALWGEVATELKCTEADCKEKWRHLRSNFMREKRKMMKLPSGSARSLTRRWMYYDAMEFLLPHVTPRPTSSSVPTPMDEDTCHEMEDAIQNSSHTPDIAVQDNASPREGTASQVCNDANAVMPKPTSKPSSTKKRSRSGEDEMDLRFLNEMKQLREEASSQNDPDRQYLLMKKLSPSDNIDIRIEICEIFRRKLFQPIRTDQYGYRTTNQNQSFRPSSSASNESATYAEYSSSE